MLLEDKNNAAESNRWQLTQLRAGRRRENVHLLQSGDERDALFFINDVPAVQTGAAFKCSAGLPEWKNAA